MLRSMWCWPGWPRRPRASVLLFECLIGFLFFGSPLFRGSSQSTLMEVSWTNMMVPALWFVIQDLASLLLEGVIFFSRLSRRRSFGMPGLALSMLRGFYRWTISSSRMILLQLFPRFEKLWGRCPYILETVTLMLFSNRDARSLLLDMFTKSKLYGWLDSFFYCQSFY